LVTEHNYRLRLDEFPRFPLTFLPTPLVRAGNLERALGESTPQIWIKRDDMTGLAFGGNKTRHNEFIFGEAVARNAVNHFAQSGVALSCAM
jgi:1-aminocyclopropane-1-carboxylate deaminase/D-cysteine desulfhydrase-like pyridoxal-dependent ACC family enzyme